MKFNSNKNPKDNAHKTMQHATMQQCNNDHLALQLTILPFPSHPIIGTDIHPSLMEPSLFYTYLNLIEQTI